MVINKFYFSNGESAESLKEFMNKVADIDDDCFLHHVNDRQNDFANWIEFCVKDKVLANRVRKIKEKEEIVLAIKKRLNTPARAKKGIIEQIKRAILQDG